MSAFVEKAMAKPKGRPKSERDDVTIRVSRPVASQLKMLASLRGVTVAEIVDELFTSPLSKAYSQAMRKLEPKEGKE